MPKTGTLVLALLLAALVTPAPAAAGWFSDDPATIHVPHLRVGDRLLFADAWTPPAAADGGKPAGAGATTTATATAESLRTVVLLEGVGAVPDRYGVSRDVATFLTEHRLEDDAFLGARCHGLQGGDEAVRVDPTSGGAWGTGWGTTAPVLDVLGSRRLESNSTLLSLYAGRCEVSNRFGGRTLAEGDRLSSRELLPYDLGDADVLSRPAVATQLHGRPALRFSFDPEALGAQAGSVASLDAVLADGLPVVAQVRVTAGGELEGASFSRDLAGIERGAGPELAPYVGATLPERDPAGAFSAPGPRTFDDRAFALPFPYAEAYEGLLAHPTAGFASWLARHPDAILHQASYRRDTGSDPGVAGEGTWHLSFVDGASVYDGWVSRHAGVRTHLGVAPAPVKVVDADGTESTWEDAPGRAFVPEQVASSASIARAAASAGLPRDAIVALGYAAAAHGPHRYAQVWLSSTDWQEEDTDGLDVQVDALSGGLYGVYSTSVRTVEEGGILAPAEGAFMRAERGSALAALAGPGVGSGLAVGGAAATGLALLLVFLKLVAVPLFTRLRRDRLLDNPVRGRLYERIRAESGIHQAELVDFAGIGKGAAVHHVDQLVKHRFVVQVREEGFTRYYAAGEVPRDVARREIVLRAGAARQVYDLLAAEPRLSLREAAARLGISAPSVHRHKKRLEKAGLLPAAPAGEVRAAEA